MIFSVAGISRSVTIAAAYIMSVTTINHQEAFQVVRSARTAANPNIGFQRQLYEFDISGASNKVSFSLSVRATKGMFTELKLKLYVTYLEILRFCVNCLILFLIER